MKKAVMTAAIWAFSLVAGAQTGNWRIYSAYNQVEDVVKTGHTYYVLSSGNLYAYHEDDGSIDTFDRFNGMSSAGIQHIAWNPTVKKLLITYADLNIDLMSPDGTIHTLSAYANKTMAKKKTINSVDMYQQFAFISTDFGVIKIDMSKIEYTDTYLLDFSVDYTYVENGKLYAASSSHGLYAGSLGSNLIDPRNWQRAGEYAPRPKTIEPEWKEIAMRYKPEGPRYGHFGYMLFRKGKLYSCSGGYGSGVELYREGTVQVMDEDHQWTCLEDSLQNKTGIKCVDLLSLDVDPTDEEHIFASGKSGLYEFQNGRFVKLYTFDNSPLEGANLTPNKEYVLVESVKFDDKGNLWCLNSQAKSHSLLSLGKDKQWKDHHSQDLMLPSGRSMSHLKSLLFDDNGRLWFGNYDWNNTAIMVFDLGNEQLSTVKNFTDQDGNHLSISAIQGITKDMKGDLWIATPIGPFVIPAADLQQFPNTGTLVKIKVPRNDGTNLADYLLDGVNISAICIDGANRKWVGTKGNGVFLLSEDGLNTIQHYTKKNSFLISDNIESIAINTQSGEVFIGTDIGLCSVMGDATDANDDGSQAYAFPNPVEPGYEGLITVNGLRANSAVKIVTSSGRLIKEGTSNGGTFTWDGTDTKGKKVASGVYLVWSADAEGRKGAVCKIAIIR